MQVTIEISFMESVLLTLFNIATIIKWVSETDEIALENKEYINQISYSDSFYQTITYAKGISAISQNFLIILCCSFLDEFEKEFTPFKFPEYSEAIIRVKKITKPAINRIKKWKGLKNHRNNIISHNLRVNGVSIFECKEPIEYNIPSTNEEFKLLADLIFLVSQNIAPHFNEEVESIKFNPPIKDYFIVSSEPINCKFEFEAINDEIQKIKNST